jgi:hypothetical protein
MVKGTRMPSKSKAQARFMARCAHDPEYAKEQGISVTKAKEWNKEDARQGNLKKGSKLPARKAGPRRR